MSSFSVFHWAILALLCYMVFKGVTGLFSGRGEVSRSGSMICQSCGTRCEPRTITKGSLGIEVILWICFIIPGVLYTIWRLTTRHKGCPKCGSASVIPTDTPMGRKFISDMEIK